ncbi:MAG TPA: hypothetical protein DD490_05180 [Acidobacteria bacterium]|nr:hypothetical protein [Acidobacteriota bacterium]
MRTLLRHMPLIGAGVALVVAAAAAHATDRPGEAEAKKLVAMVRGQLAGHPTVGAAVVVGLSEGRLYLVTADHVVREKGEAATDLQIELKTLPGERLMAEVLPDQDRDLDLAVLLVRDVTRHAIVVDGFPFDQLGDPEALERGAYVFSIGQSKGSRWWVNVAPDQVAGRSGNHVEFESPLVDKGQSGGGLFDADWRLVGLVLGGQGVNVKAVLINSVLGFLRRHGYPVAFPPLPNRPSSPSEESYLQALTAGRAASLHKQLSAIQRVEVTAEVPWLEVKRRFNVSKVVPKTPAGDLWLDLTRTRVLVSLDGANYLPFARQIELEVSPSQQDVLWVKFASDEVDQEFGPFEVRGVLAAAEQKVFLEALSRRTLVQCDPSRCMINRFLACGWRATRLTLGREPGRTDAAYDLTECEGPERLRQACMGTLEPLFQLRPGETIFVGIEYSNGHRLEGTVEVERLEFSSQLGIWTELLPAADQSGAPYAAARLRLNILEIYLGAGGCHDSLAPRIDRDLLYDHDGHGLVLASESTGETTFTMPWPVGEEVAFGFEALSGKRFGPFRYQFDIAAIVRAAANQAPPPRLDCQPEGIHQDGTPRWWCGAESDKVLSWIDVRALHYGREASPLDHSLELTLIPAEVPTMKARARSRLVNIEVPAGWSDIFYSVEFKDGRRTEAFRLLVSH